MLKKHIYGQIIQLLLTPNPTVIRSKGTPRPSATKIRYKRKKHTNTIQSFENEAILAQAAEMGCPHAQKMKAIEKV